MTLRLVVSNETKSKSMTVVELHEHMLRDAYLAIRATYGCPKEETTYRALHELATIFNNYLQDYVRIDNNAMFEDSFYQIGIIDARMFLREFGRLCDIRANQ